MKRLIAALLSAGIAMGARAYPSEAVTFASLDRDSAGASVQLSGILLLPARTVPPGGFPAVIAMHGCGGMYATADGRENELAQRMAQRSALLLREGYAVLFPDSFRSRGVTEICTVRTGERTVQSSKRRLDVLGALQYLASRADIARDRIALIGW